MTDPDADRWKPWTDADLRVLLDRARATNKQVQVDTLTSELARRQDGRASTPGELFEAGERGFLEALATLCETWGAAFESDERLFLRVGKRRWMAFQHLDANAIQQALVLGGPPARRAPAGMPLDTGLSPELGGRGED